MRVALIQLNGSDDPAGNLADLTSMINAAANDGADLIATPEVSNCISTRRAHQMEVLRPEAEDETLAALIVLAQRHKIWVLIGSLALKTSDPDGRFANRSFMIAPSGQIIARYDKIHMFDVTVSETETYQESRGYRPGQDTMLAKTPYGTIGLSICYDLRFPHLYRALAQAGADVITVPSAFSTVTGAAHWEVLLRARAIETGCFVVAPAQTGDHCGRQTYGHSMVVGPWGDVLLDMGMEPGWATITIDLSDVSKMRRRIPSLSHDRSFASPIMRGDEGHD